MTRKVNHDTFRYVSWIFLLFVQGNFLDRQNLAKPYEIMIKINKSKEILNNVKGVA